MELLLQTMGLAHLTVLTVNQWAGTHIQTGYFCCCGLVSCWCCREHFYSNTSQEFVLLLLLLIKSGLLQVFGNNSELFDIHVEWVVLGQRQLAPHPQSPPPSSFCLATALFFLSKWFQRASYTFNPWCHIYTFPAYGYCPESCFSLNSVTYLLKFKHCGVWSSCVVDTCVISLSSWRQST